MDHLGISNCELRVLGVRIISLCGYIKRTIKDYVHRFTYEFSEIHMPKLLRKVEDLIRRRIGDEIRIPLILADEKQQVVATLLQKAENVAQLKGDLAQDLSGVVNVLGQTFNG